jgi:hypothetical protein
VTCDGFPRSDGYLQHKWVKRSSTMLTRMPCLRPRVYTSDDDGLHEIPFGQAAEPHAACRPLIQCV